MRDDGTQTDQQMMTAFFDKKDDAEQAVERLESAGVKRHDIQLVAGRNAGGSTQQQADEDKGILDTLKDWFIPEKDREGYSEGLRRGGYIVRVDTDRAQRDRVFDILDDEGTVDMDERENEWRSEGWGGSGQHKEADSVDTGAQQALGDRRDTDHDRKRVRSYSVEGDRSTGDHDATEKKPHDPSSAA